MQTLAEFAAAVIAFGAMCVAVFAADFSRRQANAAEAQAEEARRQADAAEDQVIAAREQAEAARDEAAAAREQAEVAKDQAAAAWQQVEAAKRANEISEEERAARRAVEAVQWSASVDGRLTRIRLRNVGTETAHSVGVARYGEDDDWTTGVAPEQQFDEIRAGDDVSFRLSGGDFPEKVYVLWDGAPHPRAVKVTSEV